MLKMEWWAVLITGMVALVALYTVGRMLMHAYFRAKVEYVETVTRKLERGDIDAE